MKSESKQTLILDFKSLKQSKHLRKVQNTFREIIHDFWRTKQAPTLLQFT